MTSIMKKEDILTVLLKGAAGAIPIAGPLFSEIIGAAVPNQRVDRIEELAKSLEKKLDKISEETLQQKIKEPETVDLFEDALIQSTRALSQERIDYIASMLKNSMTQEELDHLDYKRLLSILAELNDAEVVILIAKSYERGLCQEEPAVSEFMNTHKSILKEKFIHMGSPAADREKNALYHNYRANLVRLGLLRYRYKRAKKGELPDFDQNTGAIKTEGTELTVLGKLLLREIDQEGALLQ